MGVRTVPFGAAASLFLLDAGGIRAAVTDFGAALVSLHHPDGTDVVLGFDDEDGYRADTQYMGVIVGRCANRIACGRFALDGHVWTLPCNAGRHHLHGGPDGFGRRLWRAEANDAASAVRFTLVSPHLDQGYPGRVVASATYHLTAEGRLRLTLEATADRPTLVNLAPHGYVDLAGTGDIRGHELRLHAARHTPVDGTLIPTGAIAPVAGTPLDFRTARPFDGALDNNFVVDGSPGTVRPVAEVRDPVSGRTLAVSASAPGVQVYGGGNLAAGGRYPAHAGFCLEPQYFPDSPNHPRFIVPRVAPDRPYRELVEYRFGRQDR